MRYLIHNVIFWGIYSLSVYITVLSQNELFFSLSFTDALSWKCSIPMLALSVMSIALMNHNR